MASPVEALALLEKHLQPILNADTQKFQTLLKNLGHPRFAVRSKAQADLEAAGFMAEPALRRALAANPTLEVRQRVQKVLDRLCDPLTRPEVLRPLRALAVLEDIDTPTGRNLLQTLASGAPAARLTREAQASLARLQRRRPAVP